MLSLTVLGAGPKAIAVQAKAHALRRMGLPAPEILVIDPQGVGGNWLSGGGWTNGHHLLGTSPMKDVGFPYRTRIVDPPDAHGIRPLNQEVDRFLFEVSWPQFLIDTSRYPSWVDRGHPAPRHREWAAYLTWVAERTDLNLLTGTIRTISVISDPGRWSLEVHLNDGQQHHVASDALMITGPGTSSRRIAELPQVHSLSSFWHTVTDGSLPEANRIAVIGGGESAASIINELVRHPCQEIHVISPAATIFSRGESQFENSLYTEPTRWLTLDDTARRDVISRTDHGVFSRRTQDLLHVDDRVSHLRGTAESAVQQREFISIRITDPVLGTREENFDLVVDARGNSPTWFTELMDEEVLTRLTAACRGVPTPARVEERIGTDLSLTGVEPKLFLPTLSGLRQGPGFANLSCLGELSDRVLAGLGVGMSTPDLADEDGEPRIPTELAPTGRVERT